jgi:hypothetical protein
MLCFEQGKQERLRTSILRHRGSIAYLSRVAAALPALVVWCLRKKGRPAGTAIDRWCRSRASRPLKSGLIGSP